MLTIKHLKKAARQRSQYGEPRSGEMQHKVAKLIGHDDSSTGSHRNKKSEDGKVVRRWDRDTGEFLVVVD